MMFLWAHRGASAAATENTQRAFELAKTLGADGIELDIRLTADGHPMVFHDKTLAHAFSVHQAIEDLPLAAIRNFKHADGQRVLTFDEALEVIDPSLHINVEIKAPRAGRGTVCINAVLEALRARTSLERILVSSFDPRVLYAMRRAAPQLKTALLFEANTPLAAGMVPLARWLGVQALHPESLMVSPTAIKKWQAAGFAVNVWTVNNPIDIAYWQRHGATGIFTDDVVQARALVIAAEKRGPLG